MSRGRTGSLLVLVMVVGCGGTPAPEPIVESKPTEAVKPATPVPTVSIAATTSAREVLQDIAADFQAETKTEVKLSFGSATHLLPSLEFTTTRPDLYLVDDKVAADAVEAKDLVAERRDLLTNHLAVVIPTASQVKLTRINDLERPDVHRFAIGDEDEPVGRYAREALDKFDLRDRLRPRFLDSSDTRQILSYVAGSKAEVGFVYTTDGTIDPKVRISLEIPDDSHSPIRYPLLLLKKPSGSDMKKNLVSEPARAFWNYLSSPAAVKRFQARGFGVIPVDEKPIKSDK